MRLGCLAGGRAEFSEIPFRTGVPVSWRALYVYPGADHGAGLWEVVSGCKREREVSVPVLLMPGYKKKEQRKDKKDGK